MPERNFLINRDSSVITNQSLGNTVDNHHPVGRHSSTNNIYRVYMRFTMDFSGMTTITNADLWMRTVATTHIPKGSSPTVRVSKLTELLNETQGGSSEGTWSGTAVPRTTLTTTTTSQSAATNMPTTADQWASVSITAMVNDWFGGGTHFGVEVRADVESTSADAWEFWSMESANDPYINVTYTTGSETYVRRSGVWQKNDEVYVRRSGVWQATAGEVYVRRSGVWVKAI